MEQIFVTFPIYVRHGKTKQFRRVFRDWDCFKLLKLYAAVRLLATLRKNKWLDCSCNFHEKNQISHKEQSGTFSENYVKPPGYRFFFSYFSGSVLLSTIGKRLQEFSWIRQSMLDTTQERVASSYWLLTWGFHAPKTRCVGGLRSQRASSYIMWHYSHNKTMLWGVISTNCKIYNLACILSYVYMCVCIGSM